MKRIVIVGASSGIGYELAKQYIAAGHRVAVAARRIDRLKTLEAAAPAGTVICRQIDVNAADADLKLYELMDAVGGCDIYIHASGIGFAYEEIDQRKEIETLQTNVVGFARSVLAAYIYMSDKGGGQLVAISSVAGLRGIGLAPAYSASKGFQQRYLQALQQKSNNQRQGIQVTDIRPGFVRTALLKRAKYPMEMRAEDVASAIVRAVADRRRVATIDWRYKLLTFLWRAVPRAIYEQMPISSTGKPQAEEVAVLEPKKDSKPVATPTPPPLPQV